MKNDILIEKKSNQIANGYPNISLYIHPYLSIDYQSINTELNTNDTTDDVIVNDIMKKYSGAWERLAEL